MSSLSKNLLLGLTMVSVLVVIVFCIQLIVINSGVDRVGTGSISGSQGQDADDGDGDDGDGDDGDIQTTPVITARPIPQGTMHALTVSDNSRLIVYARDELFSFEAGDLNWWFRYNGGGNAALEIAFTMLTAAQATSVQTESFLNRYTGGSEAVFTREETIQGSDLTGFHASARHGDEMFEVWIHDPVDSDIALAFVIRYENDTQKDALYEVLSTLDLVRLGELVTPPPNHGDDGFDAGGHDTGDGTDD